MRRFSRYHAIRSTFVICLAMSALAGAGCVANHAVHYYIIEPGMPVANVSKPDGLILLVGNITTPEALQDGRIRFRAGANEVGAYEFQRWEERPGAMVRNSLVRALRATGQYQHVLEASGPAVADYMVRGKLFDFSEVDNASIQTRISLRVELVDLKTNRDVWSHHVVREEPVSGKTVPEVVQSLDRNLRGAMSEITGGIDEFLASRH